MNEHEAEAMSRRTIREQITAVWRDEPVEEAILETECLARLGVPLETSLGDLTDEQLGEFIDWLKQIGGEMRRMAASASRLAAIRREHKG